MKKEFLLLSFLLITVGLFAQDRYEEGFIARARKIIEITADEYYPPSINISDPEKYYWPKVLARLSRYGTNDSMANYYIDLFKTRSPFHFTLVGMARIMCQFGFTPKMLETKKRYLQEVFDRDDSYNAWTAEGTENHINMSRTSGYLYALQAKGMLADAEKRQQQMANWMKMWAKKLYRAGNGEWNSDIYEVYNLIGWLNVYDFATDYDVKITAKAVLDYYAASLALHYSFGLLGGSQMRGTGIGSEQSATVYLCWLWFGGEGNPALVPNSSIIQVVHAALSTYRPPKATLELALKRNITDAFYQNSKPDYLMQRPSFIKQAFYIQPEYTLGSCFDPYGGWTGASYQMVPWKLVVKRDDQFYPDDVVGNGRFYDEWAGRIRNPYTQLAQYKNVLVQMTKTPSNAKDVYKAVSEKCLVWNGLWARDFFARYPTETYKKDIVRVNTGAIFENKSYITFPPDILIEYVGGTHFVSFGKVFLAIHSIGQKKARTHLPKVRNQRIILIDSANYDQMCGFVMEVGTLREYGSYESFKNAIQLKKGYNGLLAQKEGKITYKSLRDDIIEVQFGEEGTFEEPIVDWGYGTTERQILIESPPFLQPEWQKGKGHGRQAIWSVNGQPMHPGEPWEIYNGPQLSLKNSILEIRSSTEVYRVDFSGEKPKFP
ncbi:MAG: hypothetical protein NZM38_03370 [Cytophagales bacterium]|nr:hypothetical protein [Cytophagales bacterium]MDW8383794.1 hypothetical protein [Flammeovirgaceae bacterium]